MSAPVKAGELVYSALADVLGMTEDEVRARLDEALQREVGV